MASILPLALQQELAYALDLRRAEEELRSLTRVMELVPSRRGEANDLFARATLLRAMRLRILSQCSLLS